MDEIRWYAHLLNQRTWRRLVTAFRDVAKRIRIVVRQSNLLQSLRLLFKGLFRRVNIVIDVPASLVGQYLIRDGSENRTQGGRVLVIWRPAQNSLVTGKLITWVSSKCKHWVIQELQGTSYEFKIMASWLLVTSADEWFALARPTCEFRFLSC